MTNGVLFKEIYINYMGPILGLRGCKYILIATCRAAKFCVAKSYKNADANNQQQNFEI